jgi:hypothetical protein
MIGIYAYRVHTPFIGHCRRSSIEVPTSVDLSMGCRRPLDWSGSALTALMALWFVLRSPNRPDGAGQGAAVWILMYEAGDLMQNKERKAPFDIRRTALVCPRDAFHGGLRRRMDGSACTDP